MREDIGKMKILAFMFQDSVSRDSAIVVNKKEDMAVEVHCFLTVNSSILD